MDRKRAARAQRERTIASIAARQHGVVSRAQLHAAGLSLTAIDGRLKAGRLRTLHRGVYLLGPVTSFGTREMAAVVACGAGAFVSHASAVFLWRLLPGSGEGRSVEVTVVGRRPPNQVGIRAHGVRALATQEMRVRDRIPVTSPARTLLDVAARISPRELEQALGEVLARRLAGYPELRSLCARHRGRRGVGALGKLVEADALPARTRSPAEERFLTAVRATRLPAPRVNASLGPYEVDFLWVRERLVVEVDGYASHSSRAAFERDRLRDAELQARGFRVIRVTWRQLDDPDRLLVRIARLLSPRARD